MAAGKLQSRREVELELATWIESVAERPLDFVRGAFPWGNPKYELAKHDGPDAWQTKVLEEIGRGLGDGRIAPSEAIQIAVASGHGVGKSGLVSWLILWALSTYADSRGIVTANTEVQLRTKTWAELAKWHRLFIAKHWFDYTATALSSVDAAHEKTWRVDAVPWSERNTEAFAGLHNQGKRVFAYFDEASSIPDVIWETTEGALTDAGTQIVWAVFGNPTRNTGRFRECFGRFRHRWLRHQIDSRTAKLTNKDQIARWVADYGEDSDFVRVRVRGVFPRAGSLQFISSEVAEAAAGLDRDVAVTRMDPLVMGVDVARFGCFDDQTEILTDDGWKFFDKLTGGERVLTLNGDTAEWGLITHVHCYPYIGNLNLYDGTQTNFCVTDNHRFLVRSHQWSNNYVLREYRDLPEDYRIRGCHQWGGASIGRMRFVTEKAMPNGGIALYPYEFDPIDWASFLGWFISEGNVYEGKRNGGLRILIAQYEGPKKERLVGLLDKMGLAWRHTSTRQQIEFTHQAIGRHLQAQCGIGAHNKRIPKYLKEGSTEEISAFLDAFLMGDGTSRQDNTGRCYITSSPQLADDLQEVLAKLGRAGSIRPKNSAGSVTEIGGREVIRLHDTYVIFERGTKTARIKNPDRNGSRDKFLKKSRARKVAYRGTVWCVSTPHQTIYVRRKGCAMWSGNSDASVICVRRGRDARTIPWVKLRGVDTMELAARVVDLAREHRPDAIYVDGGGVGGGVVDRLRYLHQPVTEVQFGGKADRNLGFSSNDAIVYANKRAEMWGSMREWLKGGAIPNDPELLSDLTGVEYGYVLRDGVDAIQLERKEDMKKRGLASPDLGDSLALTFSYPIVAHEHVIGATARRVAHSAAYDPYGEAWRAVAEERESTDRYGRYR